MNNFTLQTLYSMPKFVTTENQDIKLHINKMIQWMFTNCDKALDSHLQY